MFCHVYVHLSLLCEPYILLFSFTSDWLLPIAAKRLAKDYGNDEDINRLVKRATVLRLVQINTVEDEDVWFTAHNDIAMFPGA